MLGLLYVSKPKKSLAFYTAQALFTTLKYAWKITGQKGLTKHIAPTELIATTVIKYAFNHQPDEFSKTFHIDKLSPGGIYNLHEVARGELLGRIVKTNCDIIEQGNLVIQDPFFGETKYELYPIE